MNIQPFPIISDSQVVLLRNDLYIGIARDKEIKLVTSDSQEIWTIYNNIDEAIADAKSIVEEYDFIECMIFDKDQKLLENIFPS